MTTSPQMIYLKDYRETPYQIDHVDMKFDLYPEHTDVTAISSIRLRSGAAATALVLDGRDLELRNVKIDGRQLDASEYIATKDQLTIKEPKDVFVLEVHNRIYPQHNKSLEGLYVSQGMYCTQCEATGFRGITYFYDRPDVMLTFKVTISADKTLCPVLLSCSETEIRHYQTLSLQ